MVSSAVASGACSGFTLATVAATTGLKPAACPAPATNSTSSESGDQPSAATSSAPPPSASGPAGPAAASSGSGSSPRTRPRRARTPGPACERRVAEVVLQVQRQREQQRAVGAHHARDRDQPARDLRQHGEVEQRRGAARAPRARRARAARRPRRGSARPTPASPARGRAAAARAGAPSRPTAGPRRRTSSGFPRPGGSPRAAGTRRRAAALPAGTLTSSAQRHPAVVTITPPTSWPTSTPTDRISAVQADGLRARASPSKRRWITCSVCGVISAPHAPWTSRPTSSDRRVRREPAHQRGQREPRQPGEEHVPVPAVVAEPRAGHHEHAERERVRGEDRLQHRGRGVQLVLEHGRRDGQDRGVHRGQQLAGQEQGEQAPGHALQGRAPRPATLERRCSVRPRC